MRTDKELVQIALDNFIKEIKENDYFFTGLCSFFSYLTVIDEISTEERWRLSEIIYEHIDYSKCPYAYVFIPNVRQSWSGFWWKKGNKYYRKRFLKYLLKRV